MPSCSGHQEYTPKCFSKIVIWPDRHFGSVGKMDFNSARLEAGSPLPDENCSSPGERHWWIEKGYTVKMVGSVWVWDIHIF